jgi:hypothetical protein
MRRTVVGLILVALALSVVGTTKASHAYFSFNGGCSTKMVSRDGYRWQKFSEACTFKVPNWLGVDRPISSAGLAWNHSTSDPCLGIGILPACVTQGSVSLTLKRGTTVLFSCARGGLVSTCYAGKSIYVVPGETLTCKVNAASYGGSVRFVGLCVI